MADLFNYNDPIIPQWRDTLKEITESRTAYNNALILSEIPDFNSHIQITNYTEVFPPTVPSANQFITDYRTGIITLGGTVSNGTSVSCHYFGRGVLLFPASRVAANTTNPDVISNIQDIIDNYNNLNGVDLYTKFDPNSGHKHSGNAGDGAKIPANYIPISDVGNIITANNVEDALQEHSNKIGDLSETTYSNVADGLKDHSSQLAEIVNVIIDIKDKRFGAKGDGVTDDTTAIQAAIDYASSIANVLYGRPIVGVTNGTFIFTEIIVKDNVTFRGYGGVLKVKDNTCNNANTLYYLVHNKKSVLADNLTYVGYKNVRFENLIIDGNQANNPSYMVADGITAIGDGVRVMDCEINNPPDSGIMFSAVTNARCMNNRIDGARDLGIYVNDGTGTNTHESIVSQNIITNCNAGGIGIKRGTTKVIVDDNLIYNCGNGITLENAIRSNSNDYSNNLTITNNRLRTIGINQPSMAGYGIDIRGGSHSVVTNNRVEQVRQQGIIIEGSSENIIESNILEGDMTNGNMNYNTGIYLISKIDENNNLYNSDRNKIKNNIIVNFNRRGIDLTTASVAGSTLNDNEIVGNTIKNTRTSGITLDAGVRGGKVIQNNAKDSIGNNVGLEVYAGAVNFQLVDNNFVAISGLSQFANSGVYFNSHGGYKLTGVKSANPPTGGTWAVGDRCINYNAIVGQPKSWICTVAGTPGTWTSEGNL